MDANEKPLSNPTDLLGEGGVDTPSNRLLEEERVLNHQIKLMAEQIQELENQER